MDQLKLIACILIITMIYSCSSTKKNNKTVRGDSESEVNKPVLDFSDGPPILIYKTKKDYSKNVAVTLSEDNKKIVSYPHPKDVYYKGNLAYPYKLNNGYLLDNRGINPKVVFLSITYEEYSKLASPPPLNELYQMILDKDPIVELYNCGNRFKLKNEIEEINQLIKKNQLEYCNCLKKQTEK